MAERGTRQDVSRLAWGGALSEFTAPRKASGWLYSENIPFNGLNWRWSFEHDAVEYLYDALTRSFYEDLEGPIADAELQVGDAFWVLLPSTYEPLAYQEHTTVASVYPCCDGLRVFARNRTTTDELLCLRAGSIGDDLWTSSPVPGSTVRALACDGRYLFVGFQTMGGGTKVALLDAASGALLGSVVGAGIDPVTKVATNGTRVAYIMGTSLVTRDAAPALGNSWNILLTSPVKGLCIDHDTAYVTHEWRAPNIDVTASLLASGGGIRWSRSIAAADPVGVQTRCTTDGERVFVLGLVDGSGRNLHCLSRLDGATLWSATTPAAATELCVDERWLYVSGTSNVWMVDKRSGGFVYSDPTHQWGGQMCCDGLWLFGEGEHLGVTPSLLRVSCGKGTMPFVRTSPNQRYRKPFPHLAGPIGGLP